MCSCCIVNKPIALFCAVVNPAYSCLKYALFVSSVPLSGVFRGVDMERCPPPSGRRLIFSARNNLYRENNGLVGVVNGSWNIIIPYYVQEVCSKVVTFEEK